MTIQRLDIPSYAARQLISSIIAAGHIVSPNLARRLYVTAELPIPPHLAQPEYTELEKELLKGMHDKLMHNVINSLKISDSREFTPEEAAAYEQSLNKMFRPTGRNLFELGEGSNAGARKLPPLR